MLLRNPRTLEVALSDLIERRQTNALLIDERTLLDRMIDDLETEVRYGRKPPNQKFANTRGGGENTPARDQGAFCQPKVRIGGRYLTITLRTRQIRANVRPGGIVTINGVRG